MEICLTTTTQENTYRQNDAFTATDDDIVAESLPLDGCATSFVRITLLFPRCVAPVCCIK